MKPLLVLRPEPGASKTAAKARALGLTPIVHPLFEVRPIPWEIDPVAHYDATFITSANALIFGGNNLKQIRHLPALCVGKATADAAEKVGFAEVHSGHKDAIALADQAVSRGYKRMLWLCGVSSASIDHPGLTFDVKTVYETPELPWPAEASDFTRHPVVALLHSPRAARRFAELVTDRAHISIVAISEKAAISAGPGWADVHWPAAPTDDGMLAIAAPLCRKGETGTSA